MRCFHIASHCQHVTLISVWPCVQCLDELVVESVSVNMSEMKKIVQLVYR